MKSISTSIQIIAIVLFTCFFTNTVQAQTIQAPENIVIKTIPFALKAYNSPADIQVKNESTVQITSNANTNLFNSPGGNYNKQDAAMLLFHPDSNFIFSAKVKADLKEVYDVAALVLYQNTELWAKLCYENSVDKKATVVSVVTNGLSDDCNSAEITDDYIYYLIAKKGNELSFHCSTDNINWNLVRHFKMDFNPDELMIGFAVHCSRAEQFSAEFSDINYSNNTLNYMRKVK